MKNISFLQEENGAWSSRRILAFISFLNAIFLSWYGSDWKIILIFVCLTLILLGLTTVSDIASLGKYHDVTREI